MDLSTVKTVVSAFQNWFENGNAVQGDSVKSVIDDNRRRYRMILADAAERAELGLSALPSTKSTSIVDNAVIDAIKEYYQSDAITFTAEDAGDTLTDQLAAWLTELFKLRAKKNNYWPYNIQSIKCGFVDGLEAGMVRWRKEFYKYPDNHYYDLRSGAEIKEDEYKAAKKLYPLEVEGPFDPETGQPTPISTPFNEHFQADKQMSERITADTWECVQLKPGENLLWDFKNPGLNLNRGQWAVVILDMPADDILNNVELGTFKQISREELEPYLEATTCAGGLTDPVDHTSVANDPTTVDVSGFNTAKVWVAFEKREYQWRVTFSLKGEVELSDELLVNDIFFGGRPFDRLPVFMGCSDFELWEALGRGIPKLISPIEDELSDHRNNVNDMAKQAATGKYRISPNYTADDVNSILNEKYFYANPGEVEKLDFSGEMAVVIRAADMTGGDIAALAPVSMADPYLVGKGNARDTLGGVQLASGANENKLSTRLMIRNFTVEQPKLRIIAEMMMAFESSQTLGRIAAKKAKLTPETMDQIQDMVDGEIVIDFSQLDFDVDIQINAGLGSTPTQLKARKLMEYGDWAESKGLPVDWEEIDKQIKVLNGFNEEQFILPEEKRKPKQPPVEDRLNLSVTWADVLTVAPDAAMALMQKALGGAMAMTTSVKDEKTPSYLKGPEGSASHPVIQGQMSQERPQGDMAG
jgi:hypothetical protein